MEWEEKRKLHRSVVRDGAEEIGGEKKSAQEAEESSAAYKRRERKGRRRSARLLLPNLRAISTRLVVLRSSPRRSVRKATAASTAAARPMTGDEANDEEEKQAPFHAEAAHRAGRQEENRSIPRALEEMQVSAQAMRWNCDSHALEFMRSHVRPDEWGEEVARVQTSAIVPSAAETIKAQPTRLGESRSSARDDKTRELQWESSHKGGETIDSIEQVEEVPKRTILLRSAEDSTSHAIGSALFPIRDATIDYAESQGACECVGTKTRQVQA